MIHQEKKCEIEGWVRVFGGPESAASLSEEEHGTLVSVQTETSSGDVCRKHLCMGADATLWAQYGAGPSWRLTSCEAPLLLQELFLRALGYEDPERRKRMGIDPELRHLLRFHVGENANFLSPSISLSSVCVVQLARHEFLSLSVTQEMVFLMSTHHGI
jgi:hypothetical protein